MAFESIGGLKRLSLYLAGQLASAVAITGGTINGTAIGGTTPAAGAFTTVSLTDLLTLEAATLAATGTNQATAAPIVSQVANVTGADGTVAVLLPSATAPGKFFVVYNSVATNGLPIFPAGTDTINGGSASAAITIEGKTMAVLVNTVAGSWAAIFTANT